MLNGQVSSIARLAGYNPLTSFSSFCVATFSCYPRYLRRAKEAVLVSSFSLPLSLPKYFTYLDSAGIAPIATFYTT